MSKLLWILLAFTAGAVLPIQAGMNAKVGQAGGSAVYASVISFFVGTIALIAYILVFKQTVSWAALKTIPVYFWLAGLLGAFYVTVIILSFPKLGPGLAFGLIVAGQMFISAILEHYHILVSQPQPMNLWRLLGMVMIVVGVILMRKF